MCYSEIEICAQDINTVLGFIVNTFERAYATTKRIEFFTLTSYNFGISTPILKLEMTNYVICNC